MAYVSKDIIDKIKSENDIVDVISEYRQLTMRGKNYFCVCPFHDDHSPSMSVSKDKQMFTCFSCGASGNVISFVERYEGLTFPEALKKLADRANIKIDIDTKRKVDEETQKIFDINSTVNTYFKNNLLSKDGTDAMKFLSSRGLSKEIINMFDIGLSSIGLEKLLNKKYSPPDLVKADILKEYNGRYVDTFINRIIFPIKDEHSNIIGFSGRIYKKSDDSKYYNTGETRVFKKSSVLYNINNALPEIKKKREIIITEGFMDTIRLSSIGYNNTIALMGTSFTKEHLEIIKKLKCSVVLNLDQDNPGVLATLSAGETLIENGIDVTVIVFNDYKDSDEFVVNKGKEAFDIAYNNRISFIDFKLKSLKQNKNMKDSLDVSKYINEAIESLNKVNDDILRELKIKELSKEFDINESVIRNKVKTSIVKKETKPEIKEKTRYNKYDKSELRLLYLMLEYDDVILHFENRLGYLINDDRSRLAYKIIEFRNDYGYFNLNDFYDYIRECESISNTLNEVMKYPNKNEYTDEELEDYIDTIKEYSVKRRVEALKREMNETIDINKKIEIAQKIENINREVIKW